jgi:hypothetical protein
VARRLEANRGSVHTGRFRARHTRSIGRDGEGTDGYSNPAHSVRQPSRALVGSLGDPSSSSRTLGSVSKPRGPLRACPGPNGSAGAGHVGKLCFGRDRRACGGHSALGRPGRRGPASARTRLSEGSGNRVRSLGAEAIAGAPVRRMASACPLGFSLRSVIPGQFARSSETIILCVVSHSPHPPHWFADVGSSFRFVVQTS